jgi:eukaryotic-like serine/threonine-protein kinase
MTENTHAEDSHVLPVAGAIARGEAVDWASVIRAADPETTTVLDELRALEGLRHAANPIPDAWGPFEIVRELGQGSYGTVYAARDPNLGIDVALKVIRPRTAGDSASTARALREARLLAQINDTHIVRVFWAERIGDEVGIAMELVRGQTLHHLVRANGPFSASETMLIGLDLCKAVAGVHAAHLLHGDIKANNVMRAHGGRTVLMDFGAGHDLKDAQGCSLHQTIGTPAYLAPEVHDGGPPTAASDIYSLGVLLFYLVTGTYPVRDAGYATSGPQSRHLLRDLRPDLPKPFVHVVERAMAEAPEARYASAGELEAALDRALREDNVVPPPPRPPVPRWLMAVAAAVTLALGGVGYLAWPDRTTETAAVTGPTPGTTPAAVTGVGDYRVEAAFYRREGATDVRLRPGARVTKGDELSLRIQSSVPVYAYVVNEDDQGESYLLFPLPDQRLTNPLPAATRHEIPGMVGGEQIRWEVSSAGGREHFLVFVTPEPPSPAFQRMFEGLARPSFGQPLVAQELTSDLVGALRGVGGLTKAPAATAPGGRLAEQFAVPLPESEETARGVWVRQLTLENPAK